MKETRNSIGTTAIRIDKQSRDYERKLLLVSTERLEIKDNQDTISSLDLIH